MSRGANWNFKTSVTTIIFLVLASVKDVIKKADEALYKAKNNGKNRVETA